MEACWSCGSPAAPSARLAPLPFLACAACGFAQRDDRGLALVADAPTGGEDLPLPDLEVRRRDARVRLDWMGDRVTSGGTVLDVGAAGGAFVEQAGLRGLRAWGIEPATSFARHAREVLGADVRAGLVQDHELPAASLDAITMWHVLEHLAEPAAVLTRLRDGLRPCGVLCVEVPNADSAVARALGRDWPGLQPEVHVGQYTPDALGRLLERVGFAVLELSTAPSHVYFTRREQLGPRNVLHRARFDWVARPRPGA